MSKPTPEGLPEDGQLTVDQDHYGQASTQQPDASIQHKTNTGIQDGDFGGFESEDDSSSGEADVPPPLTMIYSIGQRPQRVNATMPRQ